MLTGTVFALLIPTVLSTCYDPSPVFPVPQWQDGAHVLASAFSSIETKIEKVLAASKNDTASFSIQVTSTSANLWSHSHSASKRNASQPGVKIVDGDSLYRIASISKVFTTLGLLYQHQAGTLDLDTPISKYISELSGPNSGALPWKDITLRILASQLSGIPRDFAQSDFALEIPDPTLLGLPPVTDEQRESFPSCDEYANYDPPCTTSDLLNWLKDHGKPVFAPNQQSTYSNLAFELVGLALERATNMSYKAYMNESIFSPLNMTFTTLDTPSEDQTVIPIGNNYFGIDEGVQNPTGGIYSSANDMSKFARYILTNYNAIATGVNWLLPASWAGGATSFYGMPWETFRPSSILGSSKRPVTFVTKSGGLPGYGSRLSLLPEYGLSVTILLACVWDCAVDINRLQEIVTVELVQAAEQAVWQDINHTHAGTYEAENINSTVVLATSTSAGLFAEAFISNGTDVLNTVVPRFFVDDSRPWVLQLLPTQLYKDEKNQQGEIWRFTPRYLREDGADRGLWDEFCITDVDSQIFAGLPLTEIVFWHEQGVVELPAWRVEMKRTGEVTSEGNMLVVQD